MSKMGRRGDGLQNIGRLVKLSRGVCCPAKCRGQKSAQFHVRRFFLFIAFATIVICHGSFIFARYVISCQDVCCGTKSLRLSVYCRC